MALPYFVPSVQLPFNVGPAIARNQALEQSIADRVRAAMALASAEKVAELNNATEMAKAKLMADTERSRQAASERVAAMDPASRERIAAMEAANRLELTKVGLGKKQDLADLYARGFAEALRQRDTASAKINAVSPEMQNATRLVENGNVRFNKTSQKWEATNPAYAGAMPAFQRALATSGRDQEQAMQEFDTAHENLRNWMQRAQANGLNVNPADGSVTSMTEPGIFANFYKLVGATDGSGSPATKPSGVSGGLPTSDLDIIASGAGGITGSAPKIGLVTKRDAGIPTVQYDLPIGPPAPLPVGLSEWAQSNLPRPTVQPQPILPSVMPTVDPREAQVEQMIQAGGLAKFIESIMKGLQGVSGPGGLVPSSWVGAPQYPAVPVRPFTLNQIPFAMPQTNGLPVQPGW